MKRPGISNQRPKGKRLRSSYLVPSYYLGQDINSSTIDTSTHPINGLVLAGGYSTRMGSDKSLLVYNGKPQREYLFDLLAGCCDQVFTSCRKDQNVPASLHPLTDSFDLQGPLNGILSAMAFNPDASWLIIAVDMPFVEAIALELLISHRDKNKMATCFFNTETRQPEPLFTLWEQHAYSSLLEFAKKGNMSPREFLKTHPVNMIDPPDDKTILNYNYPQER